MRRMIGDTMMTLGGALALVLALVLFNDRVRENISTVVDTRHPSAAAAGVLSQAGDVVAIVATAARDQSIEHAPLVIFTLAGTVLVLFMLRT